MPLASLAPLMSHLGLINYPQFLIKIGVTNEFACYSRDNFTRCFETAE